MAKSCDIILEEKYQVHISLMPRIGLVIINELEDFAENWLEVVVVKDQYDIRMIAGQEADTLLGAARYLVNILNSRLPKAGSMPCQMDSLMKFILNLNLRTDILNNRNCITALGTALGSLASFSQ